MQALDGDGGGRRGGKAGARLAALGVKLVSSD